LVIEEFDLDRPGRLNRLGTWYEPYTLRFMVRQGPIWLHYDSQRPAPPRDLVDPRPELSERGKVATGPSRSSRDVADAYPESRPEQHLGKRGPACTWDRNPLDIPAKLLLENAPPP
jgi:hypothetical protein